MLQWSSVLTVVSPVTHTDVVAVNSESINGVTVRSFVAIGKESNNVPNKIATRKPVAIILVVENLFLCFRKTIVLSPAFVEILQ